jgi:hypothetical protein
LDSEEATTNEVGLLMAGVKENQCYEELA